MRRVARVLGIALAATTLAACGGHGGNRPHTNPFGDHGSASAAGNPDAGWTSYICPVSGTELDLYRWLGDSRLTGEVVTQQVTGAAPNEHLTQQTYQLTGTKQGPALALRIEDDTTITATEDGDNLDVQYPGANGGLVSVTCGHGTEKDFNDSVAELGGVMHHDNQAAQAQADQQAAQAQASRSAAAADLALSNASAQVQREMGDLSGDHDTSAADVQSAGGDLQSMRDDASQIAPDDPDARCSDVGGVESDLGGIISDAAGVKVDLETIQADIGRLKSAIATLNQATAAEGSDDATLQHQAAAAIGTVAQQANALAGTMTNYQSQAAAVFNQANSTWHCGESGQKLTPLPQVSA